MARHEVLSPIPGVFYRRPDPGSAEYTRPGEPVGPQDTIGLVEVMKAYFPVPAGAAGTVVEFAVGSEQVVDAGQVLAVLEVDG
ncbi:acetyl-CoA carboxylase [Pseudonocardia sp.]|uniref:acetyl-CoA carboxylase n=1 Tax=Pseudonocardia sp. TaxID=60912 RepID=UPI003D0D1480